jgi:hypothetical protein
VDAVSKRPAETVLRGIDASGSEEATHRVLAMSEGERRRELEAAGVDLRRLRASATNLYDELHPAKPGEAPKPRGPSWRPGPRERDRGSRWLWAILAITASILGLLWIENRSAPSAGPAASQDAGIE